MLSCSTATDRALIHRIQQGDEAALAVLYTTYRRLVFTIALRITDQAVLAEEIVQDVFYGVWRDAHTFCPDQQVATWIMSIARHRAIDATRRRSFHLHARSTAFADDLGLVQACLADTVVDRLAVGLALARLPANQRIVLELAYREHWTYAQIAAQLGQPLGTITTRARLGLAKLQQWLHDDSIDA